MRSGQERNKPIILVWSTLPLVLSDRPHVCSCRAQGNYLCTRSKTISLWILGSLSRQPSWLSSPKYAEIDHFTLLPCRGRLRNSVHTNAGEIWKRNNHRSFWICVCGILGQGITWCGLVWTKGPAQEIKNCVLNFLRRCRPGLLKEAPYKLPEEANKATMRRTGYERKQMLFGGSGYHTWSMKQKNGDKTGIITSW